MILIRCYTFGQRFGGRTGLNKRPGVRSPIEYHDPAGRDNTAREMFLQGTRTGGRGSERSENAAHRSSDLNELISRQALIEGPQLFGRVRPYGSSMTRQNNFGVHLREKPHGRIALITMVFVLERHL